MSPEVLATLFTGLNALVLVYFQARRSRRDELLEDMDTLRKEREELRGLLEKTENARDEWRDRYYSHLGEVDAKRERPSEHPNCPREGG